MKRMKELEDENCQGHDRKKVVKPARRRELACRAKVEYGVSTRVACEVLSISTTCYFYKPTLVNENAEIEDWLKRLTTTHKRWGFGLRSAFLRNTKGFKWNHKRVWRIFRELELNLRIKPRSQRDKPDALAVPTVINQVWSMDFGISLPSQRVRRSLL